MVSILRGRLSEPGTLDSWSLALSAAGRGTGPSDLVCDFSIG
jgi:hypothetical protein